MIVTHSAAQSTGRFQVSSFGTVQYMNSIAARYGERRFHIMTFILEDLSLPRSQTVEFGCNLQASDLRQVTQR